MVSRRRGEKLKGRGAGSSGAAGGVKWRTFARQARVGIATVNTDLRFIHVNDALAAMAALPASAHSGKEVAQCCDGFKPELRTLLQNVFATGEPALSIELTGPRARQAGPRRNYLTYIFPLGDRRGGRPRRVRLIIIDVTEQRETYENLQESVGKYRTLMDYAPDGLLVLDARGNFVDANRRAGEIMGYEAEELIGTNFRELVADERGRPDPLNLRDSVGGRAALAECVLRRRDRTLVPVEINVRAIDGGRGRVLAVVRDASARRATEEKLIHDAFHDALTGLPNRALFTDRLRQSFERARRYKEHRFAVLFLDLDNFKEINDHFGHDVGDELLKAVGDRLYHAVRAGDTVARLGGDEFTILADETQSAEEVAQIAARIEKELSLPFRVGKHKLSAAGSIGICIHDPARHSHPEDVLHDADRAMYVAKTGGKGGYVFHSEQARGSRSGKAHRRQDAAGKAGVRK